MSKLKRRLQMNKRLIFNVDRNPSFADAKRRLDQIREQETPRAEPRGPQPGAASCRTPIDPAGFDYEERPRP